MSSNTGLWSRYGEAPRNGILASPAAAMPRGVAVVLNGTGDGIALAGAGVRPYGFLQSEVTLTGPSLEDLQFVPEANMDEVKVSVGKVQVMLLQTGNEYIISGNILSGTVFAIGERVVIAANGEYTDVAGASSTDKIIGTVTAIGLAVAGQTGGVAFKAEPDLELVP